MSLVKNFESVLTPLLNVIRNIVIGVCQAVREGAFKYLGTVTRYTHRMSVSDIDVMNVSPVFNFS